eukprot:g4729.t1
MLKRLKNRLSGDKDGDKKSNSESGILNMSLLEDDATPIVGVGTLESSSTFPLTGGGFGTTEIGDDDDDDWNGSGVSNRSYIPITIPGIIGLGRSEPQQEYGVLAGSEGTADDQLSAGELRTKYSVRSCADDALGGGQTMENLSPQEARKRSKLRAEALAKQKANNAQFLAQMKAEEDAYLARHKARKQREDADLALALELSRREQYNASIPQQRWGNNRQGTVHQRPPPQQQNGLQNSKLVLVSVPPGGKPGQVLTVAVPGHGTVRAKIPQGVQPGQQFQFSIQTHKLIRFVVPPQLDSKRQVRVSVPGTNEKAMVHIPEGINAGEEILVRVDIQNIGGEGEGDTPQEIDESAPAKTQTGPSKMTKSEQDEFLANLPEDIRRELLASGAMESQTRRLLGEEGEATNQVVLHGSTVSENKVEKNVKVKKEGKEIDSLLDNDSDDSSVDTDDDRKQEEKGRSIESEFEPSLLDMNIDTEGEKEASNMSKSHSGDVLSDMFANMDMTSTIENENESNSAETLAKELNSANDEIISNDSQNTKEKERENSQLTRSQMLERLKTAKLMLEEGLISQEEHDDTKKSILALLKAAR